MKPSSSDNFDHSKPSEDDHQLDPSESRSTDNLLNKMTEKIGQDSQVKENPDGTINPLASVGGWLGIGEAVIPGFLFLSIYTFSHDLMPAIIAAVIVALIFTVIRLVRKQRPMMAISGLIGVGISAFFAARTGDGSDYYVPGFFTTGGSLVIVILSLIFKYPATGVMFGFIRKESLQWRKDPQRYKQYVWATVIIGSVLLLRLAVQVPLYFMGDQGFVALGTTRLLMGVPLYCAALFVAWIISEPSKKASKTSTTKS